MTGRGITRLGLVASALVLLAGCAGQASSQGESSPGQASYLFVISGEAGTIDGVGQDTGSESLTLTLHGVNDHATQFADRPIREAFVLSTTDLVDRWAGWFADAAPNAVLTFTEPGDPMPHNIVLELSDPSHDKQARTLTFAAKHLHRASDLSPDAKDRVGVPPRRAPEQFTTGTLFIDSVAGEFGGAENSVAGPQRLANTCEIRPKAQCAKADLSDADLAGVDLTGANLSSANLDGATLDGANLTGANLTNAHLEFVYALDANFTDANLAGATVYMTHLNRANLTGAKLAGTWLTLTEMEGVILTGVDLSDTALGRVYLSGARWPDGRICGRDSIGTCD